MRAGRTGLSPGCLGLLLAWAVLCQRADAYGATRRPYGGNLKLPVTDAIATMDPARVSTAVELELARQVHETLYRVTAGGVVVPVLAQDLPQKSRGGREWIIRLRPGAKFHDGSLVTAEEVLAAWERLLHPETASPHWWLLAPVEGALAFHRRKSTKISGLEKINRLALRIRLLAPIPGFEQVLAAVPTAPLPMRWLAGKEKSNYPPGSGPFSWSPAARGGEEAALLSFSGHSRGRPYLDRVSLVAFPSPKAAGLAFELEEVHQSVVRPSRRMGFSQVVDGPGVSTIFLAVNPQRIEKLPSGFRQAVEQAVDRQALVDFLVGEQGAATDEIVAHDEPAAAERSLRGDPRSAREYFKRVMLQEKGVPPVLEFLVPVGQALEKAVAERIQVNLVDIGVVVSVVEVDRKTFDTRLREGTYDFYLAHPLALTVDLELQLLGLVAGVLGEGDVEDLLRSLDKLPVSAGHNRIAVVREMARRYQARLPWIPLFRHARRTWVHQSLRAVAQDAIGLIDYADIWLVE